MSTKTTYPYLSWFSLLLQSQAQEGSRLETPADAKWIDPPKSSEEGLIRTARPQHATGSASFSPVSLFCTCTFGIRLLETKIKTSQTHRLAATLDQQLTASPYGCGPILCFVDLMRHFVATSYRAQTLLELTGILMARKHDYFCTCSRNVPRVFFNINLYITYEYISYTTHTDTYIYIYTQRCIHTSDLYYSYSILYRYMIYFSSLICVGSLPLTATSNRTLRLSMDTTSDNESWNQITNPRAKTKKHHPTEKHLQTIDHFWSISQGETPHKSPGDFSCHLESVPFVSSNAAPDLSCPSPGGLHQHTSQWHQLPLLLLKINNQTGHPHRHRLSYRHISSYIVLQKHNCKIYTCFKFKHSLKRYMVWKRVNKHTAHIIYCVQKVSSTAEWKGKAKETHCKKRCYHTMLSFISH